MDTHHHVATTGDDRAAGTADHPFRTISRAAAVARAGDTVTVHAGVYREWVSPATGGTSDAQRIVYQAAPGEHVVISGSEPVGDWQHVGGGVWRTHLHDNMFPEVNPYRQVLGGDWFLAKGARHHLGEIFLDGHALFEVATLDEVHTPQPQEDAVDPAATMRTWHCTEADDHVVIHANFGDVDPTRALVEATVRQACFFPRATGVDYITVRGFELCHAATQWAPPTAEQIGLIGPHWAKGWIIEDNHIHGAKCSGISLGKERATGHNEWTDLGTKHGTQREREVIFRALRHGWTRDTVGSHTVRRNHIHDCGQTGICGHLGAVFSTIRDNHIHDIHPHDRWSGFEIAGIKLHAPIDVLIAGNHIHHCRRGLWMDWQAQGVRITGNVLHHHVWEDCYVEVSHGPYVIDHNIMLSYVSIKDWSQGGAYVHNLVCGRTLQNTIANRFTQYHVPHSTAVAGLMTILGGDTRYYNNLFAPPAEPTQTVTDAVDESEGRPDPSRKFGLPGTSIYDAYPRADEQWLGAWKVDEFATMKLPMYAAGNCYCATARPWRGEDDPVVLPESDPAVALDVQPDGRAVLSLTLDPAVTAVTGPLVTGPLLGQAFQPEAAFENPDGSTLVIDHDFHARLRPQRPSAGPFQDPGSGRITVTVWKPR